MSCTGYYYRTITYFIVSIRYAERLAEAGIESSLGSVGDSYDNAPAETIIGLFKTRRRIPGGGYRVDLPHTAYYEQVAPLIRPQPQGRPA